MIPSLRMVGTVVVTAATLAACGLGADSSKSCTDIGAASGIEFVFESVVPQNAGRGITAEACVADTCESEAVNPSSPWLVVGRDTLTDDSAVTVTLTIRDADNLKLFEGATTLSPTRLQPNGPGCPPIAWYGQVATDDAGLVVTTIAERHEY